MSESSEHEERAVAGESTATGERSKPKRPPDPLWEVLTELFGEVRSSRERGRRNLAIKELREGDVTPEEVRIAYDWCRRNFSTFTEVAISGHIGRALHEHAQTRRGQGSNVVHLAARERAERRGQP